MTTEGVKKPKRPIPHERKGGVGAYTAATFSPQASPSGSKKAPPLPQGKRAPAKEALVEEPLSKKQKGTPRLDKCPIEETSNVTGESWEAIYKGTISFHEDDRFPSLQGALKEQQKKIRDGGPFAVPSPPKHQPLHSVDYCRECFLPVYRFSFIFYF